MRGPTRHRAPPKYKYSLSVILAATTARALSLSETARAIYDAFQSIPSLSKVSRTKCQQFCVDVAFVALEVRSGYLVDEFSIDNPISTFSKLISSLRDKDPRFNDVAHVYESTSQQSFFVNLGLFHARFGLSRAADCPESLERWVTFVQVASPSDEVVQAPPPMLSLLSQILANGVSPPSAPTSIELTLPEGTGPEALIPLTALLLEYPVAYMLTTAGLESQAILSGVALDVYECIVSHPPLLPKGKANTEIGRGETTLVKFSCPAHLAGSYPDLHPSRMVDKVKARFEERLCRLSLEEVMDVRVKHGVETLDRVAL